MLTELKFVQGSVARKDFLPALTHFVIENGTVRGYNGTLALCSPIPFDIACKPKGDALVRAIGNCGDTVALALTPAGRLSVKSGGFKAFVDCVEGETPHVLPTGQHVPIDGAALLAGLKAVQGFIGEDASRPWANGVLLRGQSMFATNNVTLIEYWAGTPFLLAVNIPRPAVREILRIDEAPESAQFDDSSVTFHYSGGRWLRTQLLSGDWPDLARVLDTPSAQQPIPAGMFEALEKIKHFTDKLNRVFFGDGTISTHQQEGEGASYAVEGLRGPGAYNAEMLALLDGIATTIDFSTHPKPCLFQGERLRGAIIGMRI